MNAYRHLQRALPPLLVFSLVSNLAVLISPLFMMQVLDRVIPSGNTATLLLLGGLALAALSLQAGVEWGRDLALRRLSTWAEALGTGHVVATAGQSPKGQPARSQTDRSEIDRIAGLSQALASPAATAGLSLPWLPLFLLALWIIHPGFLLLLLGLLCLFGLARLVERQMTRAGSSALTRLQQQEAAVLHHAGDFAGRLGVAMIEQNLLQRFQRLQAARHRQSDQLAGYQTALAGINSWLRSLGQIMALGLGAFLVTQNALSPGGMIAASFILSRTYAAFEAAATQWPVIRQALSDYAALSKGGDAAEPPPVEIPEFSGTLRAEGLIVPRGGGAPPLLDRVSFALDPGECLAIVGSFGSGKTTLLQAISGVAPAPIGSAFLDQSELRALRRQNLYRATGYLPQRAELVAGSIAENVACFEPDRQDAQVIEAAKSAGVHGLIAALPDGYESDLAQAPYLLSAGQVQRVALARALYTKPKYLFLDEPNALLDGDGERALAQTLLRLKAEGTTIVMVLHRSGLMGLADKILRLEQGRAIDFGARAEVLARLSGNRRRMALPLLASSLQDLRDWVASQFTRSSDEAFSQKAQLVAMELFHLALAQTPSPQQDHPSVEFSLKFLNELECELRMVGAGDADLEEKMVRVRKQLATGCEPSGDQPRDEMALAAVSQMSQSFALHTQEDVTVFHVALHADRGGLGEQQPQERIN